MSLVVAFLFVVGVVVGKSIGRDRSLHRGGGATSFVTRRACSGDAERVRSRRAGPVVAAARGAPGVLDHGSPSCRRRACGVRCRGHAGGDLVRPHRRDRRPRSVGARPLDARRRRRVPHRVPGRRAALRQTRGSAGPWGSSSAPSSTASPSRSSSASSWQPACRSAPASSPPYWSRTSPRRSPPRPTSPRPVGGFADWVGCGCSSSSPAVSRPPSATSPPISSGDIDGARMAAIAAGGLLAMLTNSLMPFAYERGGELAGAATVVGFCLSLRRNLTVRNDHAWSAAGGGRPRGRSACYLTGRDTQRNQRTSAPIASSAHASDTERRFIAHATISTTPLR